MTSEPNYTITWGWRLEMCKLVGCAGVAGACWHGQLPRRPTWQCSACRLSLPLHPHLHSRTDAYLIAASQQKDGPVQHNLTLTCVWPPGTDIVDPGS